MIRMKALKYLGGLAFALTLSACGGGAPDTSAQVPATALPASVEVTVSSNSLLSAGSEILVTAV